MPVEIRELILKATVVNDAAQKSGAGGGETGGQYDDMTKQAIIAACTAQVLKILKREKER